MHESRHSRIQYHTDHSVQIQRTRFHTSLSLACMNISASQSQTWKSHLVAYGYKTLFINSFTSTSADTSLTQYHPSSNIEHPTCTQMDEGHRQEQCNFEIKVNCELRNPYWAQSYLIYTIMTFPYISTLCYSHTQLTTPFLLRPHQRNSLLNTLQKSPRPHQ